MDKKLMIELEFRKIAPKLAEEAPITFSALVDNCMHLDSPNYPFCGAPTMLEKLIKLETDLVALEQLRDV